MKTYLNVPSDFPLTKKQAWEIAYKRWELMYEENRLESAGIMWQGPQGQQMHADWGDLPAAKRQSYLIP